jgi:hypothetical protein
MKKFILISIYSTLLVFTSYAQNLKALDSKNGFRDFIFGTDVSQYQNLNLVEASKDSLTKYYLKTDDKLSIGQYDLESVFYSFYKGKLDYIIIKTK